VPSAEPDRNTRDAWTTAFFLVLVITAGVGFYAAFHWTPAARARKLKNPVPATDSALTAGMRVYEDHCLRCHGEEGDGNGEKASELSVAPTNFTDASAMNRATDGELYWEITKGRSPMPAFETKLSDMERWEAVDYIRTFAAKGVSVPGQSKAPRNP